MLSNALSPRSAERRLLHLHRLTTRLAGCHSFEQVSAVLFENRDTLLNASAGGLFVAEPGALRRVTCFGYPPEVADLYATIPLEASTPISKAFREARSLWYGTPDEVDRAYPHLAAGRAASADAAWASVPLLHDGRALGVFGLSFKTPRPFTEADRTFLEGVALQCAAALQRIALLTEMKEQREWYELALQSSDLGTWEVRPATRELLWDARSRELFGLPPDFGTVTYATFFDAIHPDDRARVEESILACLDPSRRAPYDLEFRVVGHRDGVIRWLHAQGRAEFADGLAVRMLGTQRDVSRVKAREAREREVAEFEKQLLGVVSHDLRNPLSAIIGSATMIAKDPDVNDRIALQAARVLRCSKRMQAIITDLLDFTRVRLGSGVPLHRAQTDAHRLVTQVLSELEVALPGRKVDLSFTGTGSGFWDAGRLGQVISNLIANALKHGGDVGGVSVLSAYSPTEWRFVTHNRGMPIPTEELPRLFEPYVRASNSPDREGLGLGLYIVQQLVHAHGGEVTVTSDARTGTTFEVRLPLH